METETTAVETIPKTGLTLIEVQTIRTEEEAQITVQIAEPEQVLHLREEVRTKIILTVLLLERE